jgi:hypothetical protein
MLSRALQADVAEGMMVISFAARLSEEQEAQGEWLAEDEQLKEEGSLEAGAH